MVSSMPFSSWYHEILLCGVDKLAMSVTSLSNEDGSRSGWMIPFEIYFGVSIKFFNPAALTFMFFQNIVNDIQNPYGEQPGIMHVFASLLVFIALAIVVIPLFSCDAPQMLEHNPNLEFNAD